MRGVTLLGRTQSVIKRKFHISSTRFIDPKNVEEVRIPVPWGHIAGKWWGKKGIEPILALHGWQDNAGSWDPLAAIMPEEYSILAIDFPGNGLSSHLPPLQNYCIFDTVSVLRRVKQHFGLNTFNLLGHSDGSFTSFLYSCTFPEDVKSYFGIDYVLYCGGEEAKRVSKLGAIIDRKINLSLRDSLSSKRYTKEEALNTWIIGSRHSLNKKSGEILMKRGVKEVEEGKVVFTRDQRTKSDELNELSAQEVYAIASGIRCDVCLIRALNSDYFDNAIQHCPDVLDIIKSCSNSFQLHSMHGRHHLHMDVPEKCLALLLDFLTASDQNKSSNNLIP